MQTLVVGAGAMGCWFARVLREDGPEVELAFLDTSPESARAAATAFDGRALVDSPGDATLLDDVSPIGDERFDLVCLAVPIPAASEAIATYGPRAREAVVDVTGTMADPVRAMAAAVDCQRASLHPLFAPEHEPGNVPVVVDSEGPVVAAIVEALRARGNHVFETTPAEHDRAMETVQARTHAAVLAFALAAEPVAEGFHTPVSSALSDLAAQVTGGDAHVYADIQAAFDGAEDVAEAASSLAQADPATFTTLYEEAAGLGQTGGDQSESPAGSANPSGPGESGDVDEEGAE